MRADEFSLQLSWSPQVNMVKAPVPGFYVRASYANEGEAQGVVKNTWEHGRGCNGSLVSADFLMRLCVLLEEEGILEPQFDGQELGRSLSDFAEERQAASLIAKRALLVRLRAEVDEMENQLESRSKSC